MGLNRKQKPFGGIIEHLFYIVKRFNGYAGLIFPKSDILSIMETVFDARFTTHDFQRAFGVRLLAGQTGEPILHFTFDTTGEEVSETPLQNLSQRWSTWFFSFGSVSKNCSLKNKVDHSLSPLYNKSASG